jgi:mono/diheme cytochrome c family protein
MGARRTILVGAAGVVLAVAAVAVIAFGWMGRRAESSHPSEREIALGRHIFAERCASCHGANLEGQPNWRERKKDGKLPAPPHDASGHTWHHPDQVLIGITRDGLEGYAPAGYQSDMPAFDEVLSDAEIAAVIAYIKSTWPEDIRNRQEAISRSYKVE